MKKLIIIGAGGHGRVISDIAKDNDYSCIGFLDDTQTGKDILGKTEDFIKYSDYDFIIGIGNNKIRKKIFDKLNNEVNIISLIHSSAVISSSVIIEKGTVIMPGVVVNNNTKIGKGCILNTGCSADHDNIIGDFCHISPGARLCGTVKLGNNVWICAGATVINK